MNCAYKFFDSEIFGKYFKLDVFVPEISSILHINEDIKIKSPKGHLVKGYTHLHVCVMNSKKFPRLNDYIREYIKKFPEELNKANGDGETALMISLMCFTIESNALTYKTLLELGADVHIKDKNGNTALHYALNGSYLDVIRTLVKYGSNIHAKNKLSWDTVTIYLMNSEKRDLDVFNALTDNINEEYEIECDGKKINLNLLEMTINFGHFDIAKDLLKRGATFTNPNFNAIEKCMLVLPFDYDFFDLLLEMNVKIDNYKGKHLIEYALMPINAKEEGLLFLGIETLEYIIDKFVEKGLNINMNFVDGPGLLLLTLTIYPEYYYFFEKLIKMGIDINKTDKDGNYPIEYLVNPYEKIVKLFLDNGQHINQRLRKNITKTFPSLKNKVEEIIDNKLKEIESRNTILTDSCNICLEPKSVIQCKNKHQTCKDCIKKILKYKCEFCTIEY